MFIERDNWKIESVSGTDMVLVTHKLHNDERIVSRRVVPKAATLQAMPKEDFDRAAMGVFLGWEMAKPKSMFPRLAAGLVALMVIAITWAIFFLDA